MVTRYFKKALKGFQQDFDYRKYSPELLLSKKEYIRLKRIGKNFRSSEHTVFNGQQISFTSAYWFLHSVQEIFIQQVYKFRSVNPQPLIIDCGANIGLSVIYFKRLYPSAHIIAFEADPQICDSLKTNLTPYKYDNIEIVNAAVWNEETKLTFLSEGSVGGKVDLNNAPGDNNQLEVPAVRLRSYLQTQVDFLKIDIEGAEYEVLKDCRDLLGNVENLFIEYHVKRDEEQRLHEILTWINKSGFKYYIKEAWNNMTFPFLNSYNDYYQMQLNIFCFRESN